jgi:hypothetical protein
MMNRGGEVVGGEAFTGAIKNDESWRRKHSWEVISNLSSASYWEKVLEDSSLSSGTRKPLKTCFRSDFHFLKETLDIFG